MLLSFALARVLGPFEFGTYSFILSMVSIFAIVQDGGFKTLLFREQVLASQSIYPEYDIFSTATGHLLLITCVGLILLFLFPFSNKAILLPAIIFTGLRIYSAYYSAQLKGEGRFGYEAFWQILVRSVTGCAIICALWFYTDSMASLFWAGSISLLLLIVSFVPVRSLSRFNGQHYRYLFQRAFFFLVIDAATVVYFRSDIILLKYIHPESLETGHYAASYRLLEGVILLIAPASQICFRYLRLELKAMPLFGNLLKKMLVAAISAAIVFTFTGFLFGPWVTKFIYGDPFLSAGVYTQWLLAALVFIIPNSILTQAAIALNIEKKYAIGAVVVAVVNIILNIIMIPNLGGLGAVWATLASEAVLLLILSLSVVTEIRRQYLSQDHLDNRTKGVTLD